MWRCCCCVYLIQERLGTKSSSKLFHSKKSSFIIQRPWESHLWCGTPCTTSSIQISVFWVTRTKQLVWNSEKVGSSTAKLWELILLMTELTIELSFSPEPKIIFPKRTLINHIYHKEPHLSIIWSIAQKCFSHTLELWNDWILQCSDWCCWKNIVSL